MCVCVCVLNLFRKGGKTKLTMTLTKKKKSHLKMRENKLMQMQQNFSLFFKNKVVAQKKNDERKKISSCLPCQGSYSNKLVLFFVGYNQVRWV